MLSVNYRGSTGFGKRFTAAGNLEWGKHMQDDLLDAVGWAAVQGIARADRVAIAGAGYGGYATLMGMALAPDRFACGVDLDGFENLATLISVLPTQLGKRIDDAASPLAHLAAIEHPLLVSHHADDARLPAADVKQLVDNLASRSVPVTEIADATEPTVFAAAEPFLAKCLGGSYEAGP